MTKSEALSDSLEDYLETIFNLIVEKTAARPTDIAERLDVKKSSVTGALRALAEKGLINYTPYDIITLTPKGKRRAKQIVCRHDVLRDFFTKVLAVGDDEAEECACKMEHALSPMIMQRLVQFVEFLDTHPAEHSDLVEKFAQYCREDG